MASFPSLFRLRIDVQRPIAVFLVVVFGAQSVFAWHTVVGPEAPRPVAPAMASLSLQQFVRTKSGAEIVPDRDHTIYLFEDIHLNEEAQRRIAGALQVLGQKKESAHQAFVVGIEGSVGSFDFTPYHRLSDQSAVKTIADQYLQQGLIGAAVYAALTSRDRKSEPVIVGLEDEILYRKNIESYRSAKNNGGALAAAISKENIFLDEQAEKKFPPREYVLLHIKKSYDSGKRTLTDYLHFLMEQFPELSLPPVLSAFYKVSEIEKVRTRSELEHVSLLTPVELASLKNAAPSDILNALQDSESRLMKRFALNAEQVNIVNRLRVLALVEKLKGFSLSADEWAEFKNLENRTLATVGFSSEILNPFEQFYFCAAARNNVLAGNFISALREKQTSSGALIVGGFHSARIKRSLEENGFNVVDLTPIMTNIDLQSATHYLNVFLAPGEVIGSAPQPDAPRSRLNLPIRFLWDYVRLTQWRDVAHSAWFVLYLLFFNVSVGFPIVFIVGKWLGFDPLYAIAVEGVAVLLGFVPFAKWAAPTLSMEDYRRAAELLRENLIVDAARKGDLRLKFALESISVKIVPTTHYMSVLLGGKNTETREILLTPELSLPWFPFRQVAEYLLVRRAFGFYFHDRMRSIANQRNWTPIEAVIGTVSSEAGAKESNITKNGEKNVVLENIQKAYWSMYGNFQPLTRFYYYPLLLPYLFGQSVVFGTCGLFFLIRACLEIMRLKQDVRIVYAPFWELFFWRPIPTEHQRPSSVEQRTAPDDSFDRRKFLAGLGLGFFWAGSSRAQSVAPSVILPTDKDEIRILTPNAIKSRVDHHYSLFRRKRTALHDKEERLFQGIDAHLMPLPELEQVLYARRDFILGELNQLDREYSELSGAAHEEHLKLRRAYEAKPALKDDAQFRELWLDAIGKKYALIKLGQEVKKDLGRYKEKVIDDRDIFNQRVRMLPWLTAWNIARPFAPVITTLVVSTVAFVLHRRGTLYKWNQAAALRLRQMRSHVGAMGKSVKQAGEYGALKNRVRTQFQEELKKPGTLLNSVKRKITREFSAAFKAHKREEDLMAIINEESARWKKRAPKPASCSKSSTKNSKVPNDSNPISAHPHVETGNAPVEKIPEPVLVEETIDQTPASVEVPESEPILPTPVAGPIVSDETVTYDTTDGILEMLAAAENALPSTISATTMFPFAVISEVTTHFVKEEPVRPIDRVELPFGLEDTGFLSLVEQSDEISGELVASAIPAVEMLDPMIRVILALVESNAFGDIEEIIPQGRVSGWYNSAPVDILTKSEGERLLKLLALRAPENVLPVLEDSDIEPLPISSALEALAEEGSDVTVCITPHEGRLQVALTMMTQLNEEPPANYSNEWSADLYDALYTNFLNAANEDADHLTHLDSLLVTAGEILTEPDVAAESMIAESAPAESVVVPDAPAPKHAETAYTLPLGRDGQFVDHHVFVGKRRSLAILHIVATQFTHAEFPVENRTERLNYVEAEQWVENGWCVMVVEPRPDFEATDFRVVLVEWGKTDPKERAKKSVIAQTFKVLGVIINDQAPAINPRLAIKLYPRRRIENSPAPIREPAAPAPKAEAPKPLDVNVLFGDGPIKILTDSLALKLLRLLVREMPAARIIINGANSVNGQIIPSYLTPTEVLTQWMKIAEDKKPRKFIVISKAGDSYRIGFLRKDQTIEIKNQPVDPAVFQPLLRWFDDASVMDFLFPSVKEALPTPIARAALPREEIPTAPAPGKKIIKNVPAIENVVLMHGLCGPLVNLLEFNVVDPKVNVVWFDESSQASITWEQATALIHSRDRLIRVFSKGDGKHMIHLTSDDRSIYNGSDTAIPDLIAMVSRHKRRERLSTTEMESIVHLLLGNDVAVVQRKADPLHASLDRGFVLSHHQSRRLMDFLDEMTQRIDGIPSMIIHLSQTHRRYMTGNLSETIGTSMNTYLQIRPTLKYAAHVVAIQLPFFESPHRLENPADVALGGEILMRLIKFLDAYDPVGTSHAEKLAMAQFLFPDLKSPIEEAAPPVGALNQAALRIARHAGERLAAVREAAKSTQIMKADGSPSCFGNEESARIVAESLLADFPDHHIVMDEEIEDPQLRQLNDENEKSPYQWHVHSLHGISDYVGTAPTWSFQMVLLYKGAPIVAVAIFPELKKEENPNGLLLNMRHDRPTLSLDGELLTNTSMWSFVKSYLMAQVQSAFELGSSARPETPGMQIIPSRSDFELRISQA